MVLAAGTSERMPGPPKLLLPFGEGVVLHGPVRAALAAGLDPVVVVTGHRGAEVREAVEALGDPSPTGGGEGSGLGPRLRVVHNPRFAEGQATSLARGIRAVRTAADAAAAAVLVGDEPTLPPSVVRETVETWRRISAAGRPAVARTRYRDRPGHPVVFPRALFRQLESLTGDRGARRWLEARGGRVVEVRLDRSAPVDVDDREDYRRLTGDEPGDPEA